MTDEPKKEGYNVIISKNDLNIPTLILGNFKYYYHFISSYLSYDGGISITYYTYAVFILNITFNPIMEGNII